MFHSVLGYHMRNLAKARSGEFSVFPLPEGGSLARFFGLYSSIDSVMEDYSDRAMLSWLDCL